VPDLVEKSKAAIVDVSNRRQQKIVGGFPVQYGEAPWTVSIKKRDGRFVGWVKDS
jgi:hypothetical protein